MQLIGKEKNSISTLQRKTPPTRDERNTPFRNQLHGSCEPGLFFLSQKLQQRTYYAEWQNSILLSPRAIYQARIGPRRRRPHMKRKNPHKSQRSCSPTTQSPSNPAVKLLGRVLQNHSHKLRHEEPDRPCSLPGHTFRHVRAHVLKTGKEKHDETEQAAPRNAAFSQSEDGVGNPGGWGGVYLPV